MRQAYIGVDVGTTSTRAGVFDETGTLLATARHPITIWHEAGDIVEQSSPTSGRPASHRCAPRWRKPRSRRTAVKGIGFDATCSLVVLDCRGRAAHGQRLRRPAAQRHRLDGSSRDRRGAR